MNTVTHCIAVYSAIAVINDDYSGLDDYETEQIHQWVDSLETGHICIECNAEPDFRRDEISGMMADCIEVVEVIS